jgi:capsular exopolysaccharide synthesis family protein
VQSAQKRVDLAIRYVTETLRQELQDVIRSEMSVTNVINSEMDQAKQMVSYEVEEDGLRSDLDRTKELYDIARKRLQEVDLIKDLGGYDAAVIGPPTNPKKVWPMLLLLIPISVLVGLVLGFGMAYLVDLNDRSFRSSEEIRRRLDYQVVAHIPSLAPELKGLAQGAGVGAGLDPTLVAFHKPKSRAAEAYRGVRTALFFAQGQGQRVIQVTSPNPGDGKSTLASNLAISIARSGKRVVLIDADLRKPRIHKEFNVSKRYGLSSVIAGDVELAKAIQQSAVVGLSILPCGPKPPNPAELLTSPRFEEIVDTLREQYDFVIIDTPPLLAVTDPAIVVPRVDGVLLVVRITKNGRPDAERARDILKTLDASVIGVVVNGQQIKSGYGGYGYDSYGYNAEDYSYGDYEKDGYYEHDEEDEPAEAVAPADKPATMNGEQAAWCILENGDDQAHTA